MVRHITVHWEDAPGRSHAYAQVIPHVTLHPPHIFAAQRLRPPDSSRPEPAVPPAARQKAAASTSVTAAVQQRVELEREAEDKQSSPASPTCGPPSFPSSPNKARLTSSQSAVAAIDAQLAQLRAEAADEAAGRESAGRQQRAVSATLTRRDVLQFRHSGCTGNVAVSEQVNRLMGAQHSRLSQLYQPRHSQPPPIAAQQHEQPGTIDSRNAAVSTAPFVFFSSQPRFGTDEHDDTRDNEADDAPDSQRTAAENDAARERKRPERTHAGGSGKRERSGVRVLSAAPLRGVSAQPAATDKAAARSVLDNRSHRSSSTVKHSKAAAGRSDEASESRAGAVKQSSPPPRPNPPPPAPTPKMADQHPAQPLTAVDRSALPPRPGWLSWRVGPGTDTNQPAAHIVDDSHGLLTIGKAEWKEVEVGGERRGKARVRQRRVEDEWQWTERVAREKRSRDSFTQQVLLPDDHGRVHEYDAAIAREKALEREARQQLIDEERRLNALMRQVRQATEERHDSHTSDSGGFLRGAWSAHPFIHPTFPPPPAPSSIPSLRTHPALSQAVSQPQHTHSTAAPVSAAFAPLAPESFRNTRRPATAMAHSAKPTTRRAPATAMRMATAQRASSPKTNKPVDRAAEQPINDQATTATFGQPPSPARPQQPQQLQQQQRPQSDEHEPFMHQLFAPPTQGHFVGKSLSVQRLDELDARLQRSIEQYTQQLRHDSATVDRDERYVRGMDSKDVRRQRMVNNIARAKRDIRQKEAELAALRRQLMETRQRREAAAVLAAPSGSLSSAASHPTFRVSQVGPSSASKAVQVPDVFVAVRDTSASTADNERWRLQRSIESDMAAIVHMLQSKVQHDSATQQRPPQQAERVRVEVEDETGDMEELSSAEAYHQQHEHEHRYIATELTSLSTASSSSLPTSAEPWSAEREEAMHARALRFIQERKTEIRSPFAAQ